MSQRQFRRIPFETEVQLTIGEHRWNCRLLDIALKGALMESPATLQLPPDSVANIAIPLPGCAIPLDFQAILVHQESTHLGFKFLHEELDTLTHLRTLLELNTGDPEGIRSELLTWLKGL